MNSKSTDCGLSKQVGFEKPGPQAGRRTWFWLDIDGLNHVQVLIMMQTLDELIHHPYQEDVQSKRGVFMNQESALTPKELVVDNPNTGPG